VRRKLSRPRYRTKRTKAHGNVIGLHQHDACCVI